ncbi:MAG: TetR/AcrR family transcriptional regulator [Alkalispirochaeta sp.]
METKQEILTTARDLFAQSGYEAVGIQQICTAVGITKPSLYHHFGNKEMLLAEVAADATAAFLRALSGESDTPGGGHSSSGSRSAAVAAHDAIPFSGDLVSDVRKHLAAVIDFSLTNPARFQIILQLLYPPQGSVLGRIGTPEREHIHASLARFFTSAVIAHGNLAGKEPFLATIYLGHAVALAQFLADRACAPPPDSPEVVEAAQTFIYGIF